MIQPHMTRREKILDASLRLFNEEGFHSVTAARIAKYLEMSGGHLAYHFKSKNEILLALMPRLERDLQEILRWGFPHAAPFSVDRLLYILQTLWNYRFFFVGQHHIASVEADIVAFYHSFRSHIIAILSESFDARINQGMMLPVPSPNSTALLAKNVWITWQDWLQEEQLERPRQDLPDAKSVYDVILMGYCISQPFFPDGFVKQVVEELKKRLRQP